MTYLIATAGKRQSVYKKECEDDDNIVEVALIFISLLDVPRYYSQYCEQYFLKPCKYFGFV